MIFKTFDSDIDNMSSRWGMFGKSFSDIGDTITTKWKQVTDYVAVTNDATISGMMSAWKGTSPVQFLSEDSVVNVLNDYNKALDKGAEATAKFFEAGTGNDFMNGWLKQLKGAPATMDDYKAAVAKAELAQNGLTASMVASKVAALALNVAVSMGVSIAISALIKLVDNLVHANEKAIEKAEELRDKYNDFKETNASNVKTLNDLKDEFEELSDGVSQYGDNISLTTEQYARYQEIVQQIVGMSPSLAEEYDTENGYIADKNGLLERAIELQEIEYRNELRKITNLDNLKTSMSGYIAEYKEALNGGYVTSEGNIIGTTIDTDFKNSLWKVFNTNNRDNYDGQSMARDIMESLGVKDIDKEIEKYINEYGYWQDSDFWNDYCDKIVSNLNVVTNSLTAEEVGLDDTVFDQNIEKLESYAEQYSDMKDSVKSANESIQTDLGYIAEYADGYSDLSKEQQKFVTDYLKGFGISDITSENSMGILEYDEDKMASVKSQIKKFVEELSHDDSTKQALTDLYAPPSDNETIEEYKKRIDSALEVIRKYCEVNGIEIPIGISDVEDSATDLQQSYEDTINRFKSSEESSLDELTTKYQEAIDKRKELYSGENYVGNVDINNRPVVINDDGSYSTTSTSFQEKWVGDEENGHYIIAHFTPILPDGTVLDKDSLNEYIDKILNSGNPMEADKVENGGYGILYKVDTEINGQEINDDNLEDAFGVADAWDVDMHNLQNGIYASEAEIKAQIERFKDDVGGIDGSQKIKDFFDTEGINTEDELKQFNNITKGIYDADVAIQAWNEHKKEAYELPNLSDIFALKDASGTATPLSNLKDSLDDVISSYKNLKSAVEEFRTTGSLSLETIESLIAQGDNWLDYIDLENGQLHLNEDALYSVAEAKMHQLKIQALENLAANVKDIKDAASAQEYLESTLYDTSDAYDKQAESIYEATLATLNANLANATNENDKQKIQETINKFKEDFAKLNDTLNNTNLMESVTGSSSGLGNALSDLQSLANLIKDTEKEIEDSGKISFEQIQKIASQYPVLEELLMNYINGKASEADVVNALKDTYQIDAENYSKYYKEKMSKDNSFYKNMVNNLPDTLKSLADFYNLDLGNYRNYVDAKAGLTGQLEKTQFLLDSADNVFNGNNGDKWRIPGKDPFGDFVANEIKSGAQDKIDTINKILAQFEDLSNPTFNTNLDLSDYNAMASQDKESESEKDPETFDWIERAVNNLNDALDRLKTKADDTYSSWISRNENLQHAIATTQNAIDLQSQAYARYMAQANSVPLSEAWKNVVQSGAIDISKIADEDLAKNIKEYQNWYDKAQDCLTTQEELKNSLNELNSKKFDNLQSEYEAVIELLQSQKDLIESQITVLSDKGTYDALRSEQSQILANLQSERAALQDTLNNLNIETGTEKWNEMNSKIVSIDKSIQDAYKALQDINKMQFDNLKEFYQLSIDLMDKQKSLAENRITLLSSSSDYEELKKQQTNIINMNQQQRDKLMELKNSPVFAGMSYEDQMSVSSDLADSEQKIDDAYKALKEISQLQFDNVKEAFEFNISKLEHAAKLMDDKISLAETKGLFAESYYYSNQEQMLKAQKNEISEEIAQLIKLRDSSGYEVGTSEWNSMTSELMSLREQESSLTNSIAEMTKTLRELDWEVFDYLAESTSDIIDESDFLIDLMSKGKLIDENGKFTDAGNATIAARLVIADESKMQAENYFKEAEELSKTKDVDKDSLARYNELIKNGRDALLAQKDAMKEAISLVEERYNAELNALQKVIDKKKEQMQQEKDLYDYQKSIKEKTDNIASLEKQQTAFSGDNSEETMARIQKIQLELKNAKDDLEETQYEKYLSDSQNMLDTLAEDYKNWMDERLDNEEGLLKELATNVNKTGVDVVTTLEGLVDENGFSLSESFSELFKHLDVLSGRFGEDTQNPKTATEEDAMTSLRKTLKLIPSDERVTLEKTQDIVKAWEGEKINSGTEKAYNQKQQEHKDAAGLMSKDITLADAQMMMNKALGILPNPEKYTKDQAQQALRVALKMSKGYKNGTSHVPKDGVYLTQEDGLELILSPTEGLLTPLGKGDAVFTAEQTKNLLEISKNPNMYMNVSKPILPTFTGGNMSTEMNTSIGDIHIELPNVENYTEFRDGLIKDSTFEKAMFTAINNGMLGKSTISKRKYI